MADIKAGFFSTGFYAYPMEIISGRADKARQALQGTRIEVTNVADPVVTDADIPRAVAQLKQGADYDLIVCCVSTWTESPKTVGVLREFRDIPVVIWSLGGYTQNGSLVSPASAAGATAARPMLEAMGIKYKMIYDPPDAPPNAAAVEDFAIVAKAARRLREGRIGLLGYADMGLYTTMFNGPRLRDQIGVEVESFDMLQVEQAAAEAPAEQVEALVKDMRSRWTFEQEPSDADLERLARIYIAIKKRADERNYVAFSPKCVQGMGPSMKFVPCMVLSMMGDEVHCTCECDAPGALTQTMLGSVSGQTTTFLEWYEFWPDRILGGVCGFVPFGMVDGPITVRRHGWGGFTGLINTSQMKEGRITLARLITMGDKMRMHIVTGYGHRPRSWQELGWVPPAPRFPGLEVTLDIPVSEFGEKVGAQHYAITYGDYSARLRELCRLLDIEVI
jgi:L-fucose isomerase-like protein